MKIVKYITLSVSLLLSTNTFSGDKITVFKSKEEGIRYAYNHRKCCIKVAEFFGFIKFDHKTAKWWTFDWFSYGTEKVWYRDELGQRVYKQD